MNVSVTFVRVCAAALAVAGVWLPRIVYGAEPAPELDIVVRTAVRASPDHTRMVQEKLLAYARECLSGVVASEAPPQGEAPKDGAARFRLFIEHAATLKTASGADKDTVLTDKDYFSRFLVTQEKGAYKFRLAQWKDSRYVNVDKWSSSYAVEHRLPLKDSFTSREAPAIRERALQFAYPKHVRPALLGHLLPIRIGQSRGVAGKTQSCQVIVKNASPWPLKSLEATLQWPDPRARGKVRYEGAIALTEPLAPGRQKAVLCTGEPLTLDYRWQYLKPMAVEASPVFAPVEK